MIFHVEVAMSLATRTFVFCMVLSCFCLASCVARQVQVASVEKTILPSLYDEPEDGFAYLYLFWAGPHSDSAKYLTGKISINNRKWGNLSTGSFLFAKVPAGKQIIGYNFTNASFLGESWDITLQDKETAFVEINDVDAVFVNDARQFRRVSAERGASLIQRCRLSAENQLLDSSIPAQPVLAGKQESTAPVGSLQQPKSNGIGLKGDEQAEENNSRLGPSSRSVGNRIALVIGNSSYKSSPLKNSIRDAQDISTSLRRLGFFVIQKNNATLREMDAAMNQFHASLKQSDVGLFYYAGHGIQVDGRNYLVPVDATIDSESDTKYECVDAGRILGKMEDAGNAMNIVILDACRNNPFARSFRSSSRGLVRMDAPTGSIVAYSTAPGSVAADGDGRNGVYTKHLLKFMMTPGMDIRDVFLFTRKEVVQETGGKQVPWESSSLLDRFYLIEKQEVVQ